ncbi:MAG: transaldolase, partial [Candidatus Paceibacteria bacterium]
MEVLTASVRSLEHIKAALALESDIITAPIELLREWAQADMVVPDKEEYTYDAGDLSSIPYQELNLVQDWREFDIS